MLRAFFRFLADRSGLSAVEFALVAPLLIVFYYGTVEIDSALSVNRKVTSSASVVADLVAQANSVTDTDMSAIFTALAAIMAPYDPNDGIEVAVSSIRLDAQGAARVVWSDGHNQSARAIGSQVTIPANILSGTTQTVIMAEVSFPYDSAISEVFDQPFTMDETFYLRPRRSASVCRVTSSATYC